MPFQDRFFRAVVKLLPEEFRAGYAREVEATFRAERREVRRRGRGSSARLWLATVVDLVGAALGEHLDILARDLRFAVRTMAARRIHTTTAVATLALGIGANVAMFAVVDAVLLAPLPYRDPAGLVTVAQTENGGDAGNLGYLTFVDLLDRSRSFASLAAVGSSTATLTGGGLEAERVNAMRVSRSWFDVIGVAPAIGRAFTEAEDQPGDARRVVILSDGLWRRRFAADPSAVGRAIEIGGIEHRIVGVLPRGFEDLVAARMYGGAELWYPLGYDPAAGFACRTCRHLRVFGRLAPGTDPGTAERELGEIFAALGREYPQQYHAAGAEVTRLAEVFLGPVRGVLLVLWAGVAALLLVACVNVANLLLMNASERSGEMAVRAALGVTRGRLVRQFFTEAVLLGAAGALAGLVLARLAVRWLAVAGPEQIPRLAAATIDSRAVAVALGLAVASGIVFALVPLRELRRASPATDALVGDRRTESTATWRLRAALVATNVALAALLLVGSGLLVRSLNGLLAVAPGFDPSGVLTMQLWAAGPAFREGEDDQQIGTTVRFYDEVLSRVRALPGVTAAAAVTTLPMGGGVDAYGFHVEGRPTANPEEAPDADRFVVTPGFFATLRIPLVRGRLLDEQDHQASAPVVVINRTAAEALFGAEDPIGRRVSLGPPNARPRTIVGVVGDLRHRGLDAPAGYQVYVPQAQWEWAETFMTLVVRSGGKVTAPAGPVRDIVREIDSAQPVTAVRSYEEVVAASIGSRRFAAGLLTAFAVTALAMAMVGLYGVLGVMVGQRRRELALRIALGARRAWIRRMVLLQGLRPVALGLAAGLALATASVGALRSMLFGIEELDPATFLAAAAVLVGCATGACLLPAWRATRCDPARCLRGG